MKRTHTTDLIESLRNIATDYAEFGLTKDVLLEAADRLAKQQKRIRNQRREIGELAKDKHRVDGFVNWLNAEIRKCDFLTSTIGEGRFKTLVQAKKQLEKLRNGLGEQ